MSAIGESRHSQQQPWTKKSTARNPAPERPLYAPKQTFGYTCPEGPFMTQSGLSAIDQGCLAEYEKKDQGSMKHSLSDWSSIAEIAAAFGVILSLIFVGLQIKEGNEETRASTMQVALETEMMFQAEILRYGDTWEKVATGVPITDPVEIRRGIILYNMMMTVHENRYHQYQAGYIDNLPASLARIVKLPFFDSWRGSVGAGSRTRQYLELVDNLRDQDPVQ